MFVEEFDRHPIFLFGFFYVEKLRFYLNYDSLWSKLYEMASG